MCSIFGYYSNSKIINEDLERKLKDCSNLMKHRGPDASGFYISQNKKVFLANNRLSIIDLDPRSNQPFQREGLVIVFNGEIYNYKELQKLLKEKNYQFHTDSDTEVILLLYKEFGKECLKFLRGMFAFAIYDISNDTLFCARDRIGEKPFIYHYSKDFFIFSSEIPSLLSSGLIKKDINWSNLAFYYSGYFLHIPEPFSLWQDIKKLEPASYLVLKDGRILEKNFYWRPEVFNYKKVNKDEIIDSLIKAVDLTTVADVPISLLLSGGADSTIIAYILKKELKKDFIAFTCGKDENDEEIKRAEKVAKFLNIELKKIYFDIKHIDNIKDLIKIYGEPIALPTLIYSDILYKKIKELNMKVVLNGSGGDEIFYGYTFHNKTLLYSYILRFLRPFIKNKTIKIKRTQSIFRKRYKKNNKLDINLTPEILFKLFNNYEFILKPFEKKLFIDFSNFFALILENAHSITILGDLSGMNNSIEVRNPFLDYKLVELAFSIHPYYKIGKIFDNSGTYNKFILKEIFSQFIPKELLFKPKMGFGFNISSGSLFNNFSEKCLNIWKSIFINE